VQTVISFVAPGAKAGDERRVDMELLDVILGGSFTSRLNQNLRERNGFTYGARSSFAFMPWGGWLTAGARVKTEVTGAALTEFFNEFARLSPAVAAGVSGGKMADVTSEEVAKAIGTARVELIRAFESLDGITSLASSRDEMGLGWESVASDLARARKSTSERLNALGGEAVAISKGVLVLVGDKGKIAEQLKDVQGIKGLEIVEVSATGEAVVGRK
jgi:zinc protease